MGISNFPIGRYNEVIICAMNAAARHAGAARIWKRKPARSAASHPRSASVRRRNRHYILLKGSGFCLN